MGLPPGPPRSVIPQLHPKEMTQIWMAVGAIAGTILAALLGDWLGRRLTYSFFCLAFLGSVLLFFQGNALFHQGNAVYGPMFLATCFLAGLCTASFYGWLPLYLPELFTTNVRATGQGFGFNFGRILAAIGTLCKPGCRAVLFRRFTSAVTNLWGAIPFLPVRP